MPPSNKTVEARTATQVAANASGRKAQVDHQDCQDLKGRRDSKDSQAWKDSWDLREAKESLVHRVPLVPKVTEARWV